MSNASVDIRVYRAKELRALDMAELLRASIVGNTILHGCNVTQDTTTGRLNITSGRVVLCGRLGVITGGEIEMPDLTSVTGTALTYYLVLVCDLSVGTAPMYISLVSSAQKSALDTSANGITDDEFNTTNGLRYLLMGTATINATTNKVTGWSAVADAAVVHNMSYYVEKLTELTGNSIVSLRTELTTRINNVADSGTSTHSVATAMSWINYIRKRLHSTGNFAVDSRTAGSSSTAYFTVAAGKAGTICFPKAKNGVTKICASADYRTVYKNQYNAAYSGGTAVPTILCKPDGTIYDELPGNTVNWSTSNDRYGVPLAADTRFTPYAIVAVNIAGTNADNCLIQSFGFTGEHAYVRVRNIGTAKALLVVSCRIFYIQAE